MNSAKNQLPGFLLADLFKNSLVMVEEAQKAEKIVPKQLTMPERQWYLGSNLRKITLLVKEKEAGYLPDDSLQFLSSILGACKLNLGDVAIVNYYNDPVGYAFLKETLSPGYLLLFDVTAKEIQLPFTIPYYQVQPYDNCSFLRCPPLDAMLGNSQSAKLEKSKLWLCLKNMFSL
ncbi:MAG: hypothetical protein Q8R50_04660 [Sediminibacterium sp.]|nr:hypothetical protein [Sediminibacterium sp.]